MTDKPPARAVLPPDMLEKRCERCGRAIKDADDWDQWNMDFYKGFLLGAICPDCQTDEDYTEAEVNAAMADNRRVIRVELTDDDQGER